MSEKLPAEFRKYLSKLGRKGGLKGGPARAASMTPERRSEIARKAVMARWNKKKQAK
jgi:general stress protein YciG